MNWEGTAERHRFAQLHEIESNPSCEYMIGCLVNLEVYRSVFYKGLHLAAVKALTIYSKNRIVMLKQCCIVTVVKTVSRMVHNWKKAANDEVFCNIETMSQLSSSPLLLKAEVGMCIYKLGKCL